MHWRKPSNTSHPYDEEVVFEVIHPFHPLYKQKFKLFNCRRNWDSYRVYFYNSNNQLVSLPISWTSVLTQDPFIKQAAGRSLFRVTDLLRLSDFIQTFDQEINQVDSDKLEESVLRKLRR